MCTKYPEIWNALAAPFHSSNVRQRTGYDYITARTLMNRLDEVMGPENWWDDYSPLEHGFICRLTLRMPDGQLLTKVDSGADSTTLKDAGDADKGGMADAFKRAGVKFGVFRYGYKDGVVVHGAPADTSPSPVRRAITAPPITAPSRQATPSISPPCEGGVKGGGPVAPAAAQPPPKPQIAAALPAPAPVCAGSEDAQGRGGRLVYGRASSRLQPPSNSRPKTGEDLHYFAANNPVDPALHNWIVNSFNPQGYSAKLLDWTPDEVRQAWPSIREHLLVVKASNARRKATA